MLLETCAPAGSACGRDSGDDHVPPGVRGIVLRAMPSDTASPNASEHPTQPTLSGGVVHSVRCIGGPQTTPRLVAAYSPAPSVATAVTGTGDAESHAEAFTSGRHIRLPPTTAASQPGPTTRLERGPPGPGSASASSCLELRFRKARADPCPSHSPSPSGVRARDVTSPKPSGSKAAKGAPPALIQSVSAVAT